MCYFYALQIVFVLPCVILCGVFALQNALYLWHYNAMKMSAKDHQKREFARLCATGTSPQDAYRQAYKKPKLSDKAAKLAAWRLKKDAVVCEAIESIESQVDDAAVLKRQAVLELLSRNIVALDAAGNTKMMVACVAELNKMMAYYAPAKVEVKSDIVHDFVSAQLERAGSEPLVRRLEE